MSECLSPNNMTCSNRGQCVCGQCECNERPNPDEVIVFLLSKLQKKTAITVENFSFEFVRKLAGNSVNATIIRARETGGKFAPETECVSAVSATVTMVGRDPTAIVSRRISAKHWAMTDSVQVPVSVNAEYANAAQEINIAK